MQNAKYLYPNCCWDYYIVVQIAVGTHLFCILIFAFCISYGKKLLNHFRTFPDTSEVMENFPRKLERSLPAAPIASPHLTNPTTVDKDGSSILSIALSTSRGMP